MKFIYTILVFFLGLLSLNAKPENLKSLFEERSKCIVNVTLSIHTEEYREQISCLGFIANDDGLVVLGALDLPNEIFPDEFKEVKIKFFGGDIDGYKAKYLGKSYLYNVHFVQFTEKMPEQLCSYEKFPQAKAELGDSVWGISLNNERNMFTPYYLTSYVSQINKEPYSIAYTQSEIAACSTPVYNNDGALVGFGGGKMLNVKTMLINNEAIPSILLFSEVNTNSFWFVDFMKKVIIDLPSTKYGNELPWLGLVGTKVLTSDVAKMLGITKKTAFVVGDVVKNSPAGRAGLKQGDIIVGFDGEDYDLFTNKSFALSDFFKKYAVMKNGDKATLSIIRGSDKAKDFELILEKSPKIFQQSKTKYFKRIGFSVREYLFSDSVNRNEIDNMYDVPVVRFVKKSSPAESAKPSNLSGYDMITQINSQDVKSYDEAVELLSKLDDDESVKEIIISAKNYNETKVVRIKID